MSLLQIKVRQQCCSVTWRPGRGGYWSPVLPLIEHGDLAVQISNGRGVVEVKIFSGNHQRKPICRKVIRKDGTYILGAKKIKKM